MKEARARLVALSRHLRSKPSASRGMTPLPNMHSTAKHPHLATAIHVARAAFRLTRAPDPTARAQPIIWWCPSHCSPRGHLQRSVRVKRGVKCRHCLPPVCVWVLPACPCSVPAMVPALRAQTTIEWHAGSSAIKPDGAAGNADTSRASGSRRNTRHADE